MDSYRKEERENLDKNITEKEDELNSLTQKLQELTVQEESINYKVFENIENEEERKNLKLIIQNPKDRTRLLSYFRENTNIEELKQNLVKKEQELKELEQKVEKNKNYREILHEEITKLERRKNIIEISIKDVKNDLDKDFDFGKKIIETQFYTNLINNVNTNFSEGVEEENIIQTLVHTDTLELNSEQFISTIRNRLISKKRTVLFNDLANYLITIHQNFITVFAGLPGVGKTSLIDKLAKTLGLEDNNYYLKISVPRGWTSSKDILGYYNPLTRKFQSSKTKLVDYLKKSEKDRQIYPCFILLDEANLSPIEHYWSEFSSIADDDYKKEIQITDNEKIEFGNSVRFIATINYDHTTEVLSDRLISRAPVIKLSSNLFIDDNENEANSLAINELINIFPMAQLNAYLEPKPGKEYLKGDKKSKLDNIIDILQDDDVKLGNPIMLVNRKYKAIRRYCNAADSIMKVPSDNQFVVLDFAVSQYILPLLNGRGEGFKKRLESLQEKLREMPTSAKHLDKMIKVGNEFKNYKFFC